MIVHFAARLARPRWTAVQRQGLRLASKVFRRWGIGAGVCDLVRLDFDAEIVSGLILVVTVYLLVVGMTSVAVKGRRVWRDCPDVYRE